MNIEDYNESNERVDIKKEEEQNLSNNLKKIDEKIEDLKSIIKSYEEEMKNNRGEDISSFQSAAEKKDRYFFQCKEIENQSESPYFGHLIVDQDGDVFDIYVGEENIWDKKSNTIVLDSNAPVCGLFYSTQTEYTYENEHGEKYHYVLNLKRDTDIEHRKLVHCEEKFNRDDAKTKSINDYFLVKVLQQKKGEAHFSSIVKSIQSNQNDIIRTKYDKNLICQGVAGSGKTVIIGHRLRYILYNYDKLDAKTFLYIAPNNNFIEEFKEIFKSLKLQRLEDVKLSTLNNYYIDKFNRYYNSGSTNENNLFSILPDKDIKLEEAYSEKYLIDKYRMFDQSLYSLFDNYIDEYNYEIDNSKSSIHNLRKLKSNVETELNQTNIIRRSIDNSIKELSDFITDTINNSILYKSRGNAGYGFTNINRLIDEIYDKNEEEKNKLQRELDESEESISYIKYELEKHHRINIRKFRNNLYKNRAEIEKLEKERTAVEHQIGEITSRPIFRKYNEVTFIKLAEKINKRVKETEGNPYLVDYKSVREDQKQLGSLEKEIDKINKKHLDISKTIDKFKDSIEKNNEIVALIDSLDEQEDIVANNSKYINIIDECESYEDYIIEIYNLFNSYFNSDPERSESKSIEDLKYKSIMFINWMSAHYKDIDSKMLSNFSAIEKVDRSLKKYINEISYDEYYKNKNVINELSKIDNPSYIIKKIVSFFWNDKYNVSIIHENSFYKIDLITILFILSKYDFSVSSSFKYIFIDEAQDYNDVEIKLIKDLEEESILNIFGDFNQNISKNAINRTSWDSLKEILNTNIESFELNENYRNTTNVVKFCNKELNTNMFPIGLDGKDVVIKEYLNINDIAELAKNKNAVVITNNYTDYNVLKNKGIDVYTLLEIKGLEKQNAIVIDEGLSLNEKYVAYTRTLNDLIIVKHSTDKPKELVEKENFEKRITKDSNYQETVEYIKSLPSKVTLGSQVDYPQKVKAIELIDRLISIDSNSIHDIKLQKYIKDLSLDTDTVNKIMIKLRRDNTKIIYDIPVEESKDNKVVEEKVEEPKEEPTIEKKEAIESTTKKVEEKTLIDKTPKELKNADFEQQKKYLIDKSGPDKTMKYTDFMNIMSEMTDKEYLYKYMLDSIKSSGVKVIVDQDDKFEMMKKKLIKWSGAGKKINISIFAKVVSELTNDLDTQDKLYESLLDDGYTFIEDEED